MYARHTEREALANLPADELQISLSAFMAPVLTHLPEQRLRQVSLLAVRGILAPNRRSRREWRVAASLKLG